MFKRLAVAQTFRFAIGVTLASVGLLSGSLFAGDIFMSRMEVTAVNGFNPSKPIIKFTKIDSSDGWEYLKAWTNESSGCIFKDSVAGIELKGFDPGAFIDSFTADSAGGWAYLIAHSGNNLDTIIKTEWSGTWVQGCSEAGKSVTGFVARGGTKGDTVYLEGIMSGPPAAPGGFQMTPIIE